MNTNNYPGQQQFVYQYPIQTNNNVVQVPIPTNIPPQYIIPNQQQFYYVVQPNNDGSVVFTNPPMPMVNQTPYIQTTNPTFNPQVNDTSTTTPTIIPLEVEVDDPSENLFLKLKQRNYETKSTEWISKGYAFLKRYPSYSILWAIISICFCLIPYIGIIFYYLFIGGVIMQVLSHIKSERQGLAVQEPSLSESFRGFNHWAKLLKLLILVILVYLGGLICFVLPALYLSIGMIFATKIYLEYFSHGLTAWKSIKLSIALVHKNFCSIIGFLVLLFLIEVLGLLCLFVGTFVTMPITMYSLCYAFVDVVGFPEDNNVNFV